MHWGQRTLEETEAESKRGFDLVKRATYRAMSYWTIGICSQEFDSLLMRT